MKRSTNRSTLFSVSVLLFAFVVPLPPVSQAQPVVNYPPVIVMHDAEPSFVMLGISGTGFGAPSSFSSVYPDQPPSNPVNSLCDCATLPPSVANCRATHCIERWTDDFIEARVDASIGTSGRILVVANGFSDFYPADYYLFDWFDALQQSTPPAGGCGGISLMLDSVGRLSLDCEFHVDFKHLNTAIGRVASIPIGYPATNVFSSSLNTFPVKHPQNGEDTFIDPYDRVWLTEAGADRANVPRTNPNHARIVMYVPSTTEKRIYSVPGNHNEVIGVYYQSNISCVLNECQDETAALPGGGRACTQDNDCDRVWFAQQKREQSGLADPAQFARLTWFDPRLPPVGAPFTTDGSYPFPVNPGEGCMDFECGDESGRSCSEDEDCPAQCINNLCPTGFPCTEDEDCETCEPIGFTVGLCQDGTGRKCSLLSPCYPDNCCPPICGMGTCGGWEDRLCFHDQDCARGSAAPGAAKACLWDEWIPGSDCHYHEYPLDAAVNRPAYLTIGEDGGAWFSSYFAGNHIGRVNLATGENQLFPLPPPMTPVVIEFNAWDIQQTPPRSGELFGDIVFSEFRESTVTRFDTDRLYPPNDPEDCEGLIGDPLTNPCMTEMLVPGWNSGLRMGALKVDTLGNVWFSGSRVGYVQASTNRPIQFPTMEPFPNNFARGGAARQSLSFFAARDATFAVDGNVDGNWNNRSVTLTASQSKPWWEVDLKLPYRVAKVRLWDLEGSDALQDFWVMGSKDPVVIPPNDTSNGFDPWQAQADWKVYRGPSFGTSLPIDVPADDPLLPPQTRYVRVQRAGSGTLQLAEVQVINGPAPEITSSVDVDPVSGDVWASRGRQLVNFLPGDALQTTQFARWTPLRRNLAVGRAASSSLYLFPNYGPHKAVDGNPDGVHAHQSVAVTASGNQPWWQVDLGSINSISQVDFWNCTGACGTAQQNFYVLVSDLPFASNTLSVLLADSNVSNYFVAGQAQRPTIVNVNRSGRYVRVQLTATAAALSIAEVAVLGGPAAECTAPNQHVDCNDGNPCTSDICRRGRCNNECRIDVALGACTGGQTCENDKGTCACKDSSWPF